MGRKSNFWKKPSSKWSPTCQSVRTSVPQQVNRKIGKQVHHNLRCRDVRDILNRNCRLPGNRKYILWISLSLSQTGGRKCLSNLLESGGRSHLTKLTTDDRVVLSSRPTVLSEIENFYSRLYASHASQPIPENEDSRATLTRHFTELNRPPEVNLDEIEMAFWQLKNGKTPGEDGVTTGGRG